MIGVGPTVQVTEYTVWPTGCDPDDPGIDDFHFSLTVEWRAPGQYAVLRHGECLRHDGREWSYEPLPSSRTDRFKAAYRMSETDALTLARRLVDKVTVNGKTWAQWQESRA